MNARFPRRLTGWLAGGASAGRGGEPSNQEPLATAQSRALAAPPMPTSPRYSRGSTTGCSTCWSGAAGYPRTSPGATRSRSKSLLFASAVTASPQGA
jgi:hypothetical protein